MSTTRVLAATAALFSLGIGAAALAQSDFSAPVAARKGEMQNLSLNVGVLGNMARGNSPYDADMAQLAADNLVTLSMLHQDFSWPEGSDNASIEGTRALPAIWENNEQFMMRWQALGEAATGLQANAGGGLEALQAAIGPVGGACGACHDDFRQPNN